MYTEPRYRPRRIITVLSPSLNRDSIPRYTVSMVSVHPRQNTIVSLCVYTGQFIKHAGPCFIN